MRTWPSAEFASPVVVKGIARGWFDQTDVPSWSPTYLGGVTEEGAECNGVVFPVTSAELDSYSRRETGYRPMKIDPSQVTMLDGGSAIHDEDIWYFANTRKRFASVEHPIVQSYVDVCLNGCLEIEAMYPPAKGQLRRTLHQDDGQLGTAMDQRPHLSLAAFCARSARLGD